MFGSEIIDVALGLVSLFLAVSLAASAITEAIGSALKLRQKTLRTGVGALLNDPQFTGLALSLYNHALVNPLAAGGARRLAEVEHNPAYIPARNFAVALVDVLKAALPEASGAAPAGQDLGTLVAAVADPQLRQTLTALLAEAEGGRDAFLAAVAAWFDGAMDRVSGWYKRHMQLISTLVAFAVCAVLNADALRIGNVLWRMPIDAGELKLASPQDATAAIGRLDAAGLLGWAPPSLYHDPRTDLGGFLLMLLGWSIVAGASLFGAPFWFDTLQRFARLAGTGPAASRAPERAGAGR